MYRVKETPCQDTLQKVWFPRKIWQFDPFFPLVILTNTLRICVNLEVTPSLLAGFPSVNTGSNQTGIRANAPNKEGLDADRELC